MRGIGCAGVCCLCVTVCVAHAWTGLQLRNPCFVRVGLVLNDGLVLAVPACQYITTYLPTYYLRVADF